MQLSPRLQGERESPIYIFETAVEGIPDNRLGGGNRDPSITASGTQLGSSDSNLGGALPRPS